jgi:hypothetical protein
MGLDLGDVDEHFGKCLESGVHEDPTTKSGDEQISVKEYIDPRRKITMTFSTS